MAAYASSLKDAKRLQHLASKEGKDEYNSWILGDYRSVLEVCENATNEPLEARRRVQWWPELSVWDALEPPKIFMFS